MAMNMQTDDIILMKMEMWWNDKACEADYAPLVGAPNIPLGDRQEGVTFSSTCAQRGCSPWERPPKKQG